MPPRKREPQPPQEPAVAIVPAADSPEPARYHVSRVEGSPIVLEQQWNSLISVAKSLREAGAFPENIKTDPQAALILLISYELGIPYTAGTRMVDVIYNRPALRGQLVGGLLRSKGCKIIYKESTEDRCTVEITRPDGTSITNTVTLSEVGKLRTKEDGRSISLIEKSNWRQQPKVMLQRFAVKQTANMFCEDMVLGLYSDDEMEVIDGKAVDVTPREEPAGKKAALPPPKQEQDMTKAFQERVAGKQPAPVSSAPAPAPPAAKALDPDALI